MDAAARRGPAGVLRRTCLILGLLAGHTCAISSSSNNLLHLHQMPLSRGPGAHGWSSPSPEGSPLASPCSSTTNMARVQQFGSDACQQRALGKAMPSNPLRRTVSVRSNMATTGAEITYQPSHPCKALPRRSENEYRHDIAPVRYKAEDHVYTQLQVALYLEMRF
ncbi:hypothetical protein T484DRAFT_1963475 [Baffinella frigidus]|nr:hypothetical protein T484DRAFT_1963475 [Cryptophyta sp. CCMP2293]